METSSVYALLWCTFLSGACRNFLFVCSFHLQLLKAASQLFSFHAERDSWAWAFAIRNIFKKLRIVINFELCSPWLVWTRTWSRCRRIWRRNANTLARFVDRFTLDASGAVIFSPLTFDNKTYSDSSRKQHQNYNFVSQSATVVCCARMRSAFFCLAFVATLFRAHADRCAKRKLT